MKSPCVKFMFKITVGICLLPELMSPYHQCVYTNQVTYAGVECIWLFKMRRRQGGLGEEGAHQDWKWRLSIDPCTKCHFIWGAHVGRLGFWLRGPKPLWLRLLNVCRQQVKISQLFPKFLKFKFSLLYLNSAWKCIEMSVSKIRFVSVVLEVAFFTLRN